MKIAQVHSHLNGLEWLKVHELPVWEEVQEVIKSIHGPTHKTKVSKEEGRVGELLYSPIDLNETFNRELKARGWEPSNTGYWVTDDFQLVRRTVNLDPPEQKKVIEEAGKSPIYSYNQTDFLKRRVAIEVQFGKYPFITYDMFVKHLAFYIGEKIDVGIEIIAMKEMQDAMSSGPGYYEWAIYQIARQGRGAPPVPLVVVGVMP